MTEWKEYTGSDEQIAEMRNCKNGYLLSSNAGNVRDSSDIHPADISLYLNSAKSYLICNPHPLADMICRQARTGQPVWVRTQMDYVNQVFAKCYVTTTPDWSIPGAEYSFTPFEEIK